MGTPQLIPTELWSSRIDPLDPASINDVGQFNTAGNFWQRHETGPDVHGRAGHGPGYGLGIDPVTREVHSFEIDGDTLRAGMRPDDRLASGTAFVARHVWSSPSSYRAAAELPDGRNPSVPWPENDHIRFDGTRSGKDNIPTDPNDPLAVRLAGDGTGDRVFQCHVVEIQPWMFTNSLVAIGGGVHHRWTPRSPMTMLIGAGRIWIVTRTQTTPWTTGDPHPHDVNAGGLDLTPDDIGKYFAIVHDIKPDPFHGWARSWIQPGPGTDWRLIADQHGVGITYGPGDIRNLLAYTQNGTFYAWHNDPKRAPQNWEGPALRECRFGWSGAIINPPAEIDVPAVKSHAEAIHAHQTQPPPPPPPPEVDQWWADLATNEKIAVRALAHGVTSMVHATLP